MRNLILIFVVLIAASVAACGSNPKKANVRKIADKQEIKYAQYEIDDYHIGVGDRLSVNVWRNPELSIEVPVRPDGKISVPLVGDIKVGGVTPEQAARLIKENLSVYVRSPNVVVIVTDMSSSEYINRIRVTGAVRSPSSMPYRQDITVLDAVLDSGGVSDFAAPNRTKLYRKNGDSTVVYKVKLGNILYKGKHKTNYKLLPGDVLTVPERIF